MKRAFTGPDAAARYERAGKWLLAVVYGRKDARDWCDRKGVPIVKATGEGIGSGGGFLVPTELENAILDLRDSFGAFRRRARVWPMSTDAASFPRRLPNAVAYFFAEGSAASAAYAAGETMLDDVELTAKKLGAIVVVSSELDVDSAVDLTDYVANELAWALAAKEDDCAFNGTGASAYGGIRGAAFLATDGNHAQAKVTASNDAFLSLTDDDFAKLAGAVRGSAQPRAAWFASQVGLSQGLMAGVTSGYLYRDMLDGVSTTFFLGYPVIVTQKLPQTASVASGAAMMAFGDMYSAAVLGQRRGLTIARSDQRYLDTDQIAILGTERFDAVLHDMGDNTNLGSLAVLVAP